MNSSETTTIANRLVLFGRRNVVVLLVMFSTWTTLALINPSYTVVDMMRDSGQVLVVRIAAPKEGKLAGEVIETLLGEAPADKTLTFDFSEANDLPEDKLIATFAGSSTALGVMCVQKRKQDGARVGGLEIGTTWLGLTQAEEKHTWKLDKDPRDFETIWGSSAQRLIPAIRYTLSDPSPNFPVATALSWSHDLALGSLAGKAHGCLLTEAGLVILSEGGDRVLEPGKTPTDITGKLGLTSKSKDLAAGDFNGDSRIDLVSWDGTKLWLLLRGEDGQFAKPTGGFSVPECLSLAVCKGEFVIGTSSGVTLLKSDGTARQLPGAGGPCVVADFDTDGAPDILQVAGESLTLFSAEKSPVITRLPILKKPVVAVCGDYDTDGQLDLLVAGQGGKLLLSREDGQWRNLMSETGELGEASGAESTAIAACLTDLNGDGRQAVAYFHDSAAPSLFFSRGFACFGIARSLTFAQSKLPAAAALGNGQSAGIVCDLNGDLTPDLLAVDQQDKIWAMFGEPKEPRRFRLTVTTADQAISPVTVTALLGARPLGMWVVKPGEPTLIELPKAGKATLRWQAADGTERKKEIAVVSPTRVKL